MAGIDLMYCQDLGNLNFTMFAHRTDYDRPRNLQLVCDALNERWGMSLKVNKKDDIICNDQWKVRVCVFVSVNMVRCGFRCRAVLHAL